MGRERLARVSIECGMNAANILPRSLQKLAGAVRRATRCSVSLHPSQSVAGWNLQCVSVGNMALEQSERDHGAEAASAMVRCGEGFKWGRGGTRYQALAS
jgi:hypothetical protein